ncbi:PREDICTED: LON peptidase N-terminal domain and RING finger protein 3 [Nicrophorus vespilloides]|uniref:LON peptidase N-terminal domain and RING finger protein 3 n=1 Tax=Nicrophorus vespilloides TaxID=110193 RepID=A0ABM1N9S8_NICVS|nr:PREDICTED: LON peptidase N-terminal domain and RING finger protein 3 [Nicrophorus vespilloides]
MDELMVVGGAARRSVGRTSRMLRNASAQEKAVVAATTAALFEAAEAADAVYSGCDLFRCPLCRRTLSTPMTAECGHTFCVQCLDNMDMTCTICNVELGYLRAANVLVQDVVSKWRDLHKGYKSAVPGTADILGIEPRYCLRSRNAGLQTRSSPNHQHFDKLLRRLIQSHRKNRLHYLRKRRKADDNLSVCLSRTKEFRKILKNVEIVKERAVRVAWDHVTISVLECILCSRCLLDPVTTRCGHTFCRGCLARVIDHGWACPLCMAPLDPTEETRGTTLVIQEAIEFLLPEDYIERLAISNQEIQVLEKDSQPFQVPVFVCTNAFPSVACPLYVYEPRYRLLARRCLKSNTRRFAMAARNDNSEKFAPFGTVLEVRDAVHMRDGTSILTTVGVRRFRVLEKGELDGYDTATVEYIKDCDVSEEKLPELLDLHERVYSKAGKWVSSLAPKVLAEVETCIGEMPPLESDWYKLPDGPSWAWWLMPILPLSSKLQIGFLYTTDLEKRLKAIDKMLEHMKIKMRALKRTNSLRCTETVENSDSCRLSWLI